MPDWKEDEPIKDDLIIYAGLPVKRVYEVIDYATGAAVPLTDYTVKAQVRTKASHERSAGDGKGVLVMDLAPAITDEANGEITIDVTAPDDLEPGTYYWDLILTDAAGSPEPYVAGKAYARDTATDLP